MRALLILLFVAGGVVMVTRGSSAQEIIMPMPAQTATEAPCRGEQFGHCIHGDIFRQEGLDGTEASCGDESSGHSGVVPHGGLYGRCLGCRRCDDGNCACHGSYKYPVPSQYTYFWPGIYSQQAMTQYVSPVLSGSQSHS